VAGEQLLFPGIDIPQAPPTDAGESTPLAYNAADVARELRVSVKTVRRWDAAGLIPRPLKIGHCVRWPRDVILAWLAAGAPNRTEWQRLHATPPRRS
jgi:predicted DNA-binding transcriptional regulator AlpA